MIRWSTFVVLCSTTIAILLSLILNTLCVNAQTTPLSALELNSCYWLNRQYGLGLVESEQDVCGSGYFNCSVIGNQYYITTILIEPSTYVTPSSQPNSILVFVFPQLTSFQVEPISVTDVNQNILDRLKSLPNLSLITIDGDDSLVIVPEDFPTGMPLLNRVNLYNNPLLSIPTYFNNSNLDYFSVYTPTVQTMKLDDTLNLPLLSHIDMDFNPLLEQTYVISPTSLPKLQYLSLYSKGAALVNVQIKNRITDIIKLDSDNNGYILNIDQPDAVVEILLAGRGSNFFPTDLGLFTSITKFSLKKSELTDYPIVTGFPTTLTNLNFSGSLFKSIPDVILPRGLRELGLPSNLIDQPIQWTVFSDLDDGFILNVEDNPNLSGTVPESFCNHKLRSRNTSLLSLPACFMCYIGDPDIITTSVPAPTSCDLTFNTTDLVTIFNKTTIGGYALGWGNSESGLEVIKPNEVLLYTSTDPVVGPKKTINLSFNAKIPLLTFPFTVIEAGITLSGSNAFTVNTQGILLNIGATVFNRYMPHNFKLLGHPNTVCTFVNITTDGNAHCQIKGIIPNGPLTVNISNPYYNANALLSINLVPRDICTFETSQCAGNGNCDDGGLCVCNKPTFYNNCSKPYPVASSGSVEGSNQTLISLFGDFGIFGQQNPSVLINGTMSCTVTSKSQSWINCTLASTPTTFGYAYVNVTVDSLPFNSPAKVLYFVPPPPPATNLLQKCIDDTRNCYGHGQCQDNGKCICQLNYNPDDFCYTQFANASIDVNTTSPTTSFDVNGVDFSFEIIAIQEIDMEGGILKELLTESWNANITSNTTLTTAIYALNITDTDKETMLLGNTDISAVISFSSQARVIRFGNQDLNIGANSIKLSVNITNWQYSSNLATLRVVFQTIVNEEQLIQVDCQDKEVESFTNNEISSSLQYLRVVKDNVQFNGRFIDYVLSDGHQAISTTYLINQTSLGQGQSLAVLGITMPLCAECILDPDFTPLLIDKGDDQCDQTDSKTWRIIVGAVVGGVGLVSLSVGAVIVIKKKRNSDRSSKEMKRKLDRFA
ncbi:notch-like protein [Cavenderia fasciculata]|uniref:Notch-like protein n=1 Tax=Cavenderia fasciculata TaxID=261658 RepID=F4Q0H4_CACFS|nr:notch-like protein [Cavenderia fasciculata]EGG18325.1 notch-like protein [Cavenderia fasciculata]|eukprot:XP_004366229.1 notch-like protein [Cavenderia fasciculata]